MSEQIGPNVDRKLNRVINLLVKLNGMLEEKTMKPDEWLTTKEAGKMLRCSAQYVRQAIKDGKLKARQEGRAYLLSKNYIQEIIGYK